MTDPVKIGPYEVIGRLGQGGKGTVYEALQTAPVRRRVALKLLRPTGDDPHEAIRFAAEQQALALMEHPGIAKVFDAGSTQDGRHWFAMELVEGRPITEFADGARLNVRQRVALFARVCEAVQHAHQKGVIHRDLKPSNVLVAEGDGEPLPKVIDFGIAKAVGLRLAEDTLLTQFGAIIGTPAYMSPEQADGTVLNIDTRADVYSLGVMLYELLAGCLPVDPQQTGYPGFIAFLKDTDASPPLPTTGFRRLSDERQGEIAGSRGSSPPRLRKRLAGDLGWIVMMALEKDPRRRYQSAGELAQDLARYLQDQPVMARPPSAAYRAAKFVRRHRAGAAAATLAVLALGAGTTAATVGMIRAEQERIRAVAARDEAESVTDFITSMLGAASPAEQGRDVTVREVLDQAANRVGTQFAEQPLLQARMRHTLASTYGALGQYEIAREQFVQAYGIQSELLGASAESTLESRRELAAVLSSLEQSDEAVSELRGLLELETSAYGADHAGTLKTLGYLGTALVAADRLDEAEPLLREGLQRARSALGENAPETVGIMSALSQIHWQRRELEPVMELNTRILEAQQARYGDLHPSTVTALHNLATAYFLADDRKLYSGTKDGDTPELERAAELYAEAAEKAMALYGEDHPSPYNSRFMQGVCQLNLGQYEQAERAFLAVVEARKRLSGADSQGVYSPRGQLARLYIRQRRFEEARDLMSETVDGAVRTLGDEHTATQTYRYRLGIALMHLDAYEEAEAILLDAHRKLLESRGAQHDWTQWSAKVLSELYGRWGKPELSGEWLARVEPDWNAAMEKMRQGKPAPFYD
ncbi:serine/threonine-protein kinase [Lentisalinibacter salinarum]|uniref:serine/threonine-protein kinase n=1 Tax=Lentisalinibacter salinarum TaxID=2992239 RepID=UPI00386E0AB7